MERISTKPACDKAFESVSSPKSPRVVRVAYLATNRTDLSDYTNRRRDVPRCSTGNLQIPSTAISDQTLAHLRRLWKIRFTI